MKRPTLGAKEHRRRFRQSHRERLNALCREYHEKNKERIRQRRAEKARLFWAFMREYKTQPCNDCGHMYPYYVMDFDHVRGVKRKAISDMCYINLNDVFEEIQKCDLVCANCHRERTHQRKVGLDTPQADLLV